MGHEVRIRVGHGTLPLHFHEAGPSEAELVILSRHHGRVLGLTRIRTRAEGGSKGFEDVSIPEKALTREERQG